jgi:outer membrane protein assembly factor BamB
VEQASAILQSPSIAAGGLVYITGTDGQITAYRASNGGVVWSRRLTQNGFSSPTVVGNVVYAGASDHYLYTLDASTGVTLSRWKAGGPLIFTPVVVDGVAYFTSHDSSPNPNGYFAYALRLADGVTLWHVPVSGNALAVGNGIVYVGGNAPAITALNANTGATLWRDPLPPGGVIGATAPVVAGNLVYVGGDGVYALDAVSGKQRWTYPAGQVFAAPVVANGVLYVGSADGAVLSLNAVTGSPRWTFATGGQIESSLAVAGGVVYVGANGAGVYALNA